MRRPIRGSARDKWYYAGAAFIVLLVAAAAGGAFLLERDPELGADLCPKDGPTGHIVLLVDATDPFTFAQQKAFFQLIERMAEPGSTNQGTLLTVFVFGEDIKASAEPMFERCNPGAGEGKSEVTHTLKLWQKRFDSEFREPLLRAAPAMAPKEPAARSPILQMLQIVALNFEKRETRGERRLIVVSDLIQNTSELSLYRELPDYEQYRQRTEARRLRARLPEVRVETYLLLNTPQLQNRKFLKFWEDYFSDMGARSSAVTTFPG
jgi:hypothetical protein